MRFKQVFVFLFTFSDAELTVLAIINNAIIKLYFLAKFLCVCCDQFWRCVRIDHKRSESCNDFLVSFSLVPHLNPLSPCWVRRVMRKVLSLATEHLQSVPLTDSQNHSDWRSPQVNPLWLYGPVGPVITLMSPVITNIASHDSKLMDALLSPWQAAT